MKNLQQKLHLLISNNTTFKISSVEKQNWVKNKYLFLSFVIKIEKGVVK